jgi:quinol monooxygenase YgiN
VSESPLYLVVTIYPHPEKFAEAVAQLHAMAANAETEQGCEYQTLVESADEPGCVTMLEKFVSRSAWDAHMETEHNRSGNEVLEPMLSRPSVLRLYTEVAR